MISLIVTILVVVMVYKIFIFLLSLIYNRNDIADVSWGISILLIALITLIYTDNYQYKYLIVVILVSLWSLRLSARILLRNLKKSEDFRYKRIRYETKKYFQLRSFLQIYILQGMLAVIVALPIIIVGYYGRDFDIFSAFGIAIWAFGFMFEAISDFQLDIFKKDNKNQGRILKTGLWKYSRHPNYFGEITMWWGIFIMCLNLPHLWISVLGPITITLLITKVSGIPLLEKKYAGSVEFEEYKKKTSVLIPMFPGK